MDNKNLPAFPVECSYDENKNVKGCQTGNTTGWEMGLSKREYIATHVSLSDSLDGFSTQYTEKLIGEKMPDADLSTFEYFKWWAKAEALIRTLKADALLAELNKQPVP